MTFILKWHHRHHRTDTNIYHNSVRRDSGDRLPLKFSRRLILLSIKKRARTSHVGNTIQLIGPLIKKHWRAYTGLTAVMLVDLALTLGTASYFGKVTDAAVGSRLSELTWLIPVGAGLLVLTITVNFFDTFFESAAVYGVTRDLKEALYQHMLLLRTGTMNSLRSGDLLSRFGNDITAIQNMLGSRLVDVVRLPLIYLSVFIYLFQISPVLSMVSWGIAPIAIAGSMIFGLLLRRNSRKVNRLTGDNTQLVNETLQGFHVVRSFVMERLLVRRHVKQNQDLYNLEMKSARLRGFYYAGGATASALTFLVSLCLGAYFVSQKTLTVGALLTFITLVEHLVYPLTSAAGNWVNFQKATTAVERVQEILRLPVEQNQVPPLLQTADYPCEPVRSIEFRHLTFGYEPDKPVFSDLNLRIPAGKKTAIVGLSGAGKSTLFALLTRLYTPQQGSIRINGRSIASLSLSGLRESIAQVPQETFLFNGTIRDNLRLGRDVPETDLVRAARIAALDDFIRGLPQGYDTEIGERGLLLSGGQKQRVAIARALLKNAPILLLDEATAALDTETEARVKAALDHLMEGRTTIVIAHRLSTIQNADHIVVLEKGRIVQQGPHERLMTEKGLYRRLHLIGRDTIASI